MEEVLNSKFYITTPIYYVNDIPHIGHAYTTIIADTLARFHRLLGDEVLFLTGTDEHGQKIQQSAQKNGKNPKEYVDEISSRFRNLWDSFGISYDWFIRTTDSYHKETAQNVFLKMFQKGDIYKGEYEGNYCVSCESFFAKSQLIEQKKCPDCGKETNLLKEESYFFRLSAYGDRLLQWIEQNPECILPKMRRNEVINFIKEGLEDLSITRTSFDWGIKLPNEIGDSKFVMYVWLDALVNYLSALGYQNNLENKMDFWPANYHLVGKDILRFHAVYWPAFLMSLELPLPKHIAAHGWWTKDGAKMSKSISIFGRDFHISVENGCENLVIVCTHLTVFNFCHCNALVIIDNRILLSGNKYAEPTHTVFTRSVSGKDFILRYRSIDYQKLCNLERVVNVCHKYAPPNFHYFCLWHNYDIQVELL